MKSGHQVFYSYTAVLSCEQCTAEHSTCCGVQDWISGLAMPALISSSESGKVGDQQMQNADAGESQLVAESDVSDGTIRQTADRESDSADSKLVQTEEWQQAEETVALGGTLIVAPPSVVKAVWAKELASKV